MIEYLPLAHRRSLLYRTIPSESLFSSLLENCSFRPKTSVFYSQTAYLQWAVGKGDANLRHWTVHSSAASSHPGWCWGPEPTVAAPGRCGFPSACSQGCTRFLFRCSPESWEIYNCFGLRKYATNVSIFPGEKNRFPPFISSTKLCEFKLILCHEGPKLNWGLCGTTICAALAVNDFQRFSLN